MKIRLLLSFLLLLLSWGAFAQERVISGRIIDESGEALPGANIVIKGTTTGTVTDMDGNYTLSVPEGAVLSVSYAGMIAQEITVGNQTALNATLKTLTLDNVVVTGVGIKREVRGLTYGITNVKGEQLTQISEPDAIRGLTGKVAGVNITASSGAPGGSTNINIRGKTSMSSNNQPLFIVDGIPFNNTQTNSGNALTGGSSYSNRAVDIDPNNIASMTVLKGVAASALYGSRASNGVIVITTKTGAGKSSKKGLEVAVNSSYSMEKVNGLPIYQNKFGNGSDGGNGTSNYAENVGNWGPAFGTLDSIPHPLNEFAAVFPDHPEFAGKIPYKAYPNNVKDFFKTGHVLENSVTLSGGDQKANFTSVISRTNSTGVVPFTSFNRTNLSVGGNVKLDNKLTIGGTLNYVNSIQNGILTGANNAAGASPALARLLFTPRNIDLTNWPFQNPVTLGSVYYRADVDNPYWSVQENSYVSKVDRYNGNVNLAYEITPWLSASYRIGMNAYTDRRKSVIAPGSVNAGGIGAITEDHLYSQEIESTFLVTFDKDITEDFSLRAIVGHNLNERQFEQQSFKGSKIVVFGIDDLDNTNQVVPFGGNFSKRRLFGVFTDIQVGFRDYAYLNFVGRNDWSSTLPKGANSFFYPTVSGSFIFTEAFKLNSPILSFGKLRASYGKVGNDASAYAIQTTFIQNPGYGNNAGQLQFPLNSQSGLSLTDGLGNPILKPEFTTELEIGTDLQFFDNRIGLDFSYYKRSTTNQIAYLSVPGSSGFGSKLLNFGEITNEGVEVGLNLVPIAMKNNGFRWDIYTAFTKNKNKIVALTPGVDEVVFGQGFSGSAYSVQIAGQDYGVIKGNVWARDSQGNLLINPATGYPIEATQTRVIANPNPDFILGVTNTFSFKGIFLRVLVDWKQGGQIYSQSTGDLLTRGVTIDTEDREAPRIIPGVFGDPATREPILVDGQPVRNDIQITANEFFFSSGMVTGTDEAFIYDATVIKLREVSLGYDLPKAWLAKTPFGTANLSLSGRNLFYWAPGFPKGTRRDPETSTFGANNQQGFEFTNMPSVKRYGVNLRFTF